MDSNELIRRLAKLKGRLLDDVEHLAAMLANLEAEGPMSSAGEGPISTPPIQMSWEEWAGFQARLEELEAKVAALEKSLPAYYTKHRPPGPPTPAIMASPTSEALSDAEPCRHPNKCSMIYGPHSHYCPDCQTYLCVRESDSPPSSGEEQTESSPPLMFSDVWRQLPGNRLINLAGVVRGLENRLAALEQFRKTHEWTVRQTCLGGGPPSPADSSLDMTPPPATHSTGIT